jgi:hypothetical protein
MIGLFSHTAARGSFEFFYPLKNLMRRIGSIIKNFILPLQRIRNDETIYLYIIAGRTVDDYDTRYIRRTLLR